MAKDPELLAHQQWLGFVQPVDLVVSPPALLQAQAHVNKDVLTEHQQFRDLVGEEGTVKDLPDLLRTVFGWQPGDLIEASDSRAASLEIALPEYHDRLQPTFAVAEDSRAEKPSWLLLIQVLPKNGMPLDDVVEKEERRWQA